MRQKLIGGTAHELGGEVEEGEHGSGATGVALIVELDAAGEGLRADQPQDEEGKQSDQQQRGKPLTDTGEVQREAQAGAHAFEIAEGFLDSRCGWRRD